MVDISDRTKLERQRLRRLAREYQEKGYSVILHPSASELPAVLADCSIDLIAKSEDATVVVEVRTRDSLTLNGSEDLHRMTALIQQLPGWEFELVVTNHRKEASEAKSC
ncbi:hypothetical protein [Leptothermofonsia sp. ETS-13]|uniref:hypothetical protein n=1 Tax=Leptothermofonsia sp. ETS-13 TaxID=3035696 RepID=UPI003BA22CCD